MRSQCKKCRSRESAIKACSGRHCKSDSVGRSLYCVHHVILRDGWVCNRNEIAQRYIGGVENRFFSRENAVSSIRDDAAIGLVRVY